MFNMKEGKHECLEAETSKESESSMGSCSSVSESSSECDSSLEICGVTLKEPREDGGESSQREIRDEDLEKMLAKDLLAEEKEDFKVMLRKHPSLFIFDYCEILGVTVVEHQINLKANQNPVAQKLRHLGKIQQEALLAVVKNPRGVHP